jgi:DNA-binding NarL/FixJ family response regulator
MSGQTTVVVADDHPGVLAALSKYLDGHELRIVGRAGDGHDALAQIRRQRPAIAVLDIQMPGLSGIEVARRAAECTPGTAVILFSGYGSRGQLVEALDAGARGFLMKDAALAEVVRAVRVVSSGGTYVDTAVGAPLAAPEEGAALTRREREVLRLLATGARYEAIGRDLCVSTATVRKITATIKAKLGAITTTEAVAVALRRSLIA